MNCGSQGISVTRPAPASRIIEPRWQLAPIRAVYPGYTQADAFEAVFGGEAADQLLAGDLGGAVNGGRPERRVLGDRRRADVAVDADRGAEDEAAHMVEAGEIEQHRRAVDIHLDQIERLSLGHHRTRDRAGMKDGFDAFLGDQAFEPGSLLEAEKLQIRVATAEVRDVDRRDRVAPGRQSVSQRHADQT